MKIGATHSHLGGLEWLRNHRPLLWAEVRATIHDIKPVKHRVRVGEDTGVIGGTRYLPEHINDDFHARLVMRRWEGSRTRQSVTELATITRRKGHLIAPDRTRGSTAGKQMSIKRCSQIDFVKDRVAVEVQFDKYLFFMYSAFMRHLAFYVSDTIDVGIEILPMKSFQESMSSRTACYEGTLYDLVRRGRGVPAVPLVLVGVEA